ncbi:hypothetical protein CLUG_05780 [Clavispora lusitaniae ATCC 42720]|uniref:Uncharacterized protein n=1 Tax=Clavispora lusitaniae (strain ATCC 42720) TaxID=306902 RepID=C4YCE1_CLAL4|nr:uncharacterized protein CLUG_05780 [Clavispora lusitaniae ATCC 42720]EEQ41651.1 hypothetical protein CLUG_05780 [Clavispora lusitaniae ATCC 42720]
MSSGAGRGSNTAAAEPRAALRVVSPLQVGAIAIRPAALREILHWRQQRQRRVHLCCSAGRGSGGARAAEAKRRGDSQGRRRLDPPGVWAKPVCVGLRASGHVSDICVSPGRQDHPVPRGRAATRAAAQGQGRGPAQARESQHGVRVGPVFARVQGQVSV